jgi:hypothetical protein
MFMSYIIINNKEKFYFESNCIKEILQNIIEDYKSIVKKATAKGLWGYLRGQGYKINELIFVDEEDAESIETL